AEQAAQWYDGVHVAQQPERSHRRERQRDVVAGGLDNMQQRVANQRPLAMAGAERAERVADRLGEPDRRRGVVEQAQQIIQRSEVASHTKQARGGGTYLGLA